MAMLAAAGAFAATPAAASDEAFELWLNPSVGTDIDDDTAIELETAQRFRSESDGRADTYFGRIWLKQDVTGNATLSGAVEYQVNDGGPDEIGHAPPIGVECAF